MTAVSYSVATNVCEANVNQRTLTKQQVFGELFNTSLTDAIQIIHLIWLIITGFHILFYYFFHTVKFSHSADGQYNLTG